MTKSKLNTRRTMKTTDRLALRARMLNGVVVGTRSLLAFDVRLTAARALVAAR